MKENLSITSRSSAFPLTRPPLSPAASRLDGHKPEDWPRLFAERLNAGDLDGVMAPYESEVRFISPSGEMVVGREGVREAIAGLIRSKTKLQCRVVQAVAIGDIAQLYTNFEGTTTDDSAKTVEVRHKAIEVLRRQADGAWKLIMGDPNGRQ